MRLTTCVLALFLLLAGPASAQQFFDFDGQATGYTQVGDFVEMYSVVFDPSGVDTPLPLDFDNFQYTIVVTGLQVDMIAGSTTGLLAGTITLYEDAGTAADYGNLSTFVDGDAILIGEVENLVNEEFIPGLGSGAGVVNWTGGSRIDDFHPSDRGSWAFLISISAGTEAGFDARWDGKVEPQEPVVDADATSFGEFKTGF